MSRHGSSRRQIDWSFIFVLIVVTLSLVLPFTPLLIAFVLAVKDSLTYGYWTGL